MSSEDDSCTSAGSGGTSTMDLLHDSSTASLPHSQPSVPSVLSQAHPSLHHHQSSAFHHQLSNSALKVSSNASAYKVKRTRQRVDAGEPRNSYASITNFSSQRFNANNSFHGSHQSASSAGSPYHQYNGISSLITPQLNSKLGHHGTHSDHSSTVKTSNASEDTNNNNTGVFKSNYSLANATSGVTANSDRDMILFDESMMQWCASTAPAGQVPSYVNGNGNGNHLNDFEVVSKNGEHGVSPAKESKEKCASNQSQSQSPRGNESSAHLLRDILQTGRNVNQQSKTGAVSDQRDASRSPSDRKVGGNGSETSDAEEEDLNEEDTSRSSEAENANMSDDKAATDKGVTADSPNKQSSNSHSNSNAGKQHVNSSSASNGNANISEVKRARVENIVSNMLLGNCSTGSNIANGSPENASKTETLPVNGCKKRKLYQPQQSKLNSEEDEDEEEEEDRLQEDEEVNEDDFVDEIADLSAKKQKGEDRIENKDSLKHQLQTLQSQLFAMKHQYVQLFEQQQQQQRLQQLATRSIVGPFQNPVNLTTVTSPPLRDEDDADENLSEKAHTPVSQTSDRETPAKNPSLMASAIQDPAQFLDEARRILSEQERIGKRESPRKLGMSDIECLSEALKAEIQSNIFPSILQVIDATISRYFQRRDSKNTSNADPAMNASKDLTILSQMLNESKSPRAAGKVSDRSSNLASQKSINGTSRVSPFTLPTESAPAPKPSGPSPFAFPPSNFKSPFFLPNLGHGVNQTPQSGLIPPTLAHHFNTIASALSQHGRDTSAANANRETIKSNGSHSTVKESRENRDSAAPEQTEAMSLVVAPKRKRHKVTDTRITPRTVSRILGQEPLLSGMIGREFGAGSPPNQPLFSHHGPSAPPPPLVPVSLPTSVAIPNPSLHQTELFPGAPFAFADPAARFGFYAPQLSMEHHDDIEDKESSKNAAALQQAAALSSAVAAHHLSMLAAANRGSPDSVHGYQTGGVRTGVGSDSGNNDGSEVSFNESNQFDGNMPMISFSIRNAHIDSKNTLTPMHLRKAKLMFFYVRYPSSAILKMYFPDIKFNKNNTAQLVKWFSNFREFYYIQMEKYARQAISEGVKSADEIQVANDSELIRVLNLHYNRNNHIEVPDHFRFVVEQTLREFFKSIILNKDQEQSWKKAIYKVIARLDDNVPEYFKSPNFLEQLE